MMLGLQCFTVSKHVACPPLNTTSLASAMKSRRSLGVSHVWISQFPVFFVVLLPGCPRLMMLLVFTFFRMGIRIWISLALVPNGPLIGAKMCSSLPFVGVMSTKLPENLTLSRMCMSSRSPKLCSQIVYGLGLSGTIILVDFLT